MAYKHQIRRTVSAMQAFKELAMWRVQKLSSDYCPK